MVLASRERAPIGPVSSGRTEPYSSAYGQRERGPALHAKNAQAANLKTREYAMGSKTILTRITFLDIGKIQTDAGTQGRVAIDPVVVQEYSELMASGVEFPPVRVWTDGSNYWLV